MEPTEKVLSIDVGGTMTKAAILPNRLSKDVLKNIEVKKIPTLGWLNQSLAELLESDLISQFDNHYDSVTICLPCEIDHKTNQISTEDYYVKNNDIPRNIAELASQKIHKKVLLESDANAWMRGNLIFTKIIDKNISFPAFTLCLGTGVGMSIARSWDDIKEFNISKKFKGSHFKELTTVAEYFYPFKNRSASKVHQILGRNFFDWINVEKKNWSDRRIKKEFTDRFNAFLYDLRSNSPFEFDDMETLFICGGNSAHLDKKNINAKSGKKVIINNSNYIDIDPDLIPLIGNQKAVLDIPSNY